MFADSLLETSWAQRGRRSWTTLTSFGLQAVAIGLLLMIPILRNRGIAAGAHRFYADQYGTPQYGATAFRGAISELIRSNRAIQWPAQVPRTHPRQSFTERRCGNFGAVHR